MEKMMRRGGTDPWAVDFNKDLSGKDLTNPTDFMQDIGAKSNTGVTKSFSF